MHARSKVSQSISLSKSHGQLETGQEQVPLTTDFEVQNHFSIFLLCPLTDAAIAWVEENLPDDVMTFGRGICVEPRYISDIVRGIQDSGLVVR
jgi:hypothetical protein